jgi:methyl-accepting chemotaxis protein PixJ
MNSTSTYNSENPPNVTEENYNSSKNQQENSQNDLIKKIKTSLYKKERDRLWKIIRQIRQSRDLESFLQNTTAIIERELKAERVLIYRFESDNNGRVIAETLVAGWTPTLNTIIPGNCFGGKQATDYQSHGFIAIDNVKNSRLTPHQKQLLDGLQVQASLALPILLDSYSLEAENYSPNKVWGLLVVQQCSQTRSWQEEEINLLYQLTIELTRVLQPTLPRLQSGKEQNFITAIEREMQQLMKEMLHQIRQSLQADRVLVYGFNPDWSGEILAESIDSQWKKAGSCFDKDCFLTAENYQSQYVVNDVYAKDFAPCLIEALEAFEAKAYIAVPIEYNNQLLGILAVYQNSSPRNWQESEVKLMKDYASKFSFPLQQTVFIRHAQFQAKRIEQVSQQDFLTAINQDANQSMHNWLDKIRQSMKLDRAVVYGFNPDWSGKILAESFGSNWHPAGSVLDKDFHFKGGEFEPYYIANDIYAKELARAVLEPFEKMQIRAYIVVPIHCNNQLLGLLGVYQNSGPRNWQESEIKQVREFASRFVVPLQQTLYLRHSQFQIKQMEQAFEREKSLAQILEKVRLSKEEKAVFQIATTEGRKLLDVDRVALYRFNEDWSGKFVAESTASGWSSLMEMIPFIEDTFLQNTKGGRYKNGECFSVEDIYLAGHKQCHIELLEQMEARAYVIAPVFVTDSNMFGNKKLWGLIAIYQNSGARRWQNYEIETLRQIGLQVGIAMQQIRYLDRLQKQAEQEKASNRIIERIRKAPDIDEIFTVATQEIQEVLQADRSIIYQFNPDWSGQVVAESVGSGWVSLLIEQTNDKVLRGNRTQNERCLLRKWSAGDITDPDSFMQQTRGGRYVRGQKFTAVDNIYTQKFPDCYVASLEKYQARAYVIAPIFQGEKLWGLLGVYQNSGPRTWEESETQMMMQIANQLAVAIQQIDYLEQLRVQSENLTQTLERERTAKEQLQQRAIEMLRTVRPAFNGDLTVRAAVTEDEIGTIAGAYNTTLDSLKEIVLRVQTTVKQVAQTTGNSSMAIEGLSLKSQQQLEELNQALEQIQIMVDSSAMTTRNAQQVETAIEQANQTVQTGDRAMNNTVESILSIRQTVSDVGKRVKRLSDSSQKISKVVNLIGSFASQTNLLALNAALEATRAGEYGKGFAVVADEVRNLSLQSSEATTEIEKLVREIQEETQQVAAAMEAGINQVAEGTNLVNETRESLNEIVTATAQIRELVQSITSAANAQTQQAQSVTQVMEQVAEIANETSTDSLKISASFQELQQMAQNLQSGVAQFKVN